MTISIKDGKDKVWILLVMLVSCAGIGKTSSSVEDGYFRFSSVLDDDRVSMKINDSIYFDNKPIVTDRSLGMDQNTWISLKAERNPVKIEVSFAGNTVPDDIMSPVIRVVSIDTVIDLRKGKYILLRARMRNIVVEQYRKKIVAY